VMAAAVWWQLQCDGSCSVMAAAVWWQLPICNGLQQLKLTQLACINSIK